MDLFRDQQDSLTTPATMTQRLIVDARRTCQGVEDAVLERFAREAVSELMRENIRVKTFVPVLAMGQILDALESRGPDLGQSYRD